jgi:hypothetical protein
LVKLRDRARAYYGRLGTLLERISEAQPFASSAMLELLNRSIDEAEATIFVPDIEQVKKVSLQFQEIF